MAAHIERYSAVTQTEVCCSADGSLRVPRHAGCHLRYGRLPSALRRRRLRYGEFRRLTWANRLPMISRVMPPLSAFKRFDVRDRIRRGIEPFPEILQRVEALGAGEGLIVIAPFLPSPLVERLAGAGFASKVERGSGADWMVYFWRETE